MVCKICGRDLPKGSTVCPHCGAKNAEPQQKHRRSKKAKKRQRIISVIVAILALAILAAVVFGVIKMVQKLSGVDEHEGTRQAQEQKDPKPGDKPSDGTAVPADPDKKPEEETGKNDQDSGKKNDPEPSSAPENKTDDKEPSPTQDPGTVSPIEDPAGNPAGNQGSETQEPQNPQPGLSTKYTLYVSKEETTATLNHYREVRYSINEKLENGVSIKKVEWLPDDTTVCRVEKVDDLCRLWGIKYGETNVTLRVTLTDGTTVERVIAFTCAEKQPEGGSSNSGSSLGNSDYVLKNSDTRLYTESELKGLSKHDLMIARNEIYARHGYIFSDSELKSYFEGKSWYKGTNTSATFDYNCLNSTEVENVRTIRKVEASK